VPRQGTTVGGDPRYARPDAPDADAGNRLLARFTVAELLRNGITTFMEFGSQLRVQEALLGEVDRLGVRAYLGAGYDSGRWVGDERGRLARVVDEDAGWREFEAARAFIERVDVAAVDGYALDLLCRHRPELTARVRVVETTVPAPSAPLVASPSVPVEARDRLTAALLGADQAPEMKATLEDLLLTRFVATRPEDFRVFLDRQRAAEAAGYPKLA